MRKFIICLLVCLVGAIESNLAQSEDEKQIKDQVENLRLAMLKSDQHALADLTTEQLTYGHSDGKVEDKAAFIDDFVRGISIFKSIILTDQTVIISGDLALVRHRLSGETNNNQVPGKVNLLVLLVWQKSGEKWGLIARQAVKVPEKIK